MVQNRIKEVMDEQGRTRRWLAEKAGISYNALCKYCRNKSQPNLVKLAKISQHLGVSIKKLIKE